MKRQVTRKSRKRAGQALVEFALVLPVVFLVMFGVIDFGWMIFNYVQLYNGLREALRFGSVAGYSNPPQYYECNAIRDQIVNYAGFSGVQYGNITISYDSGNPAVALGTCPVGSTASVPLDNGSRVVIDVSVDVPFLTPFIRSLAPDGMNVHVSGARSIFPRGF